MWENILSSGLKNILPLGLKINIKVRIKLALKAFYSYLISSIDIPAPVFVHSLFGKKIIKSTKRPVTVTEKNKALVW